MTRKPKGKPKPKTESTDLPQLTFRQRMFVSYYLGTANGNATEAARMAGYALPNPQGCENLSKPSIRVAIDAKLLTAAMSADEVLGRLSDMAAADLGPYIKQNRGKITFSLEQIKAAKMTHLIKSIVPTKFGMRIDFHDAQVALEKLAKYHGLLIDRSEISGPKGLPMQSEIQTAAERVWGKNKRGDDGD